MRENDLTTQIGDLMNYDLILWDWNGTLLDDAGWCVDVVNRMLRKRGLPTTDLENYRNKFGFPVEEYYRKIGFDLTAESFTDLSVEFVSLYSAKSHGYALHRGVLETLSAFENLGISQAVLSASEQNNLDKQIMEFGLTARFTAVLGIGDIYARGKLELGRRYMAQRNSAHCLLVGDTIHDREVAQALGVDCVLLSHGHQSRKRLIATGAVVLDYLGDVPPFFTANRKHHHTLISHQSML